MNGNAAATFGFFQAFQHLVWPFLGLFLALFLSKKNFFSKQTQKKQLGCFCFFKKNGFVSTMVGALSGGAPVSVYGLPRRDCSFYPCAQSPCNAFHISSGNSGGRRLRRCSRPIELSSDESNMGIGSCEHSAKSSSNASSSSFIDADANARLVAQNLLLCYIEASNYSLCQTIHFFT